MVCMQLAAVSASCNSFAGSGALMTLSFIVALAAIGCSVEMQKAYAKRLQGDGAGVELGAGDDQSNNYDDDTSDTAVYPLYIGFYLAVVSCLLALVTMVASCGVRRRVLLVGGYGGANVGLLTGASVNTYA